LPLEPFVDEPVAEESAASVLLIEPFIDEPMVAEPTSSELALEPFIEEVVVAESPTLAASPEPPIEESADAEPARSESPLEPFFEEHIVEKAATVALPPENISPIDDADAPPLDNGRRIWATPVLSTTPFVPHPVRQPNAAPPWSRDQLMIAAAALGALLTIVVTRPWEYVENLQPPPANLATQSLTKPGVLPSPIPPVAKPATKAAPVPAALAEAAPMKPAAMLPETAPKQPFAAFSAPALPQTMPPFKVATAPANNPAVKPEPAEPAATESLSDDAGEPPHSNRTHTDFALVQGELMEASIRSQLARMGYASLGVAVSDEGDVYLEGTFLNQADQDRVIAMIRRYRHVRDISFSGTVWHGEQAHASRDAAEVKMSDRAAPPPTTAWHAAPSLLAPLPKVAPSAEFPITAADEPVPGGRNDAPASPLPTPSHDQSIWPVQ